MKTEVYCLLFFIVFIIFIICSCKNKENFDIPLRSSSAWDWNLGPGYGAGYGTGYAMWGIWPATLPKEPWKNWMWARRPLIFIKPFTPVPQVDYNDAPDNTSNMVSNYNISLLPVGTSVKLSVNGFAGRSLQLDRNRNYWFHVYVPGASFTITPDLKTNLIAPLTNGTVQVYFDEDDPDVLFYMIPGHPETGGTIYLNSTRWN